MTVRSNDTKRQKFWIAWSIKTGINAILLCQSRRFEGGIFRVPHSAFFFPSAKTPFAPKSLDNVLVPSLRDLTRRRAC